MQTTVLNILCEADRMLYYSDKSLGLYVWLTTTWEEIAANCSTKGSLFKTRLVYLSCIV